LNYSENNKKSLKRVIHKKTGIPVFLLFKMFYFNFLDMKKPLKWSKVFNYTLLDGVQMQVFYTTKAGLVKEICIKEGIAETIYYNCLTGIKTISETDFLKTL
jgi:hypothetical protein